MAIDQAILITILMVVAGTSLIVASTHKKSPISKAPLVAGVTMIVGLGVIFGGIYYGVTTYDVPLSETQTITGTGLAGDWDFELTPTSLSGQSHVSYTDTTHDSVTVELGFNDTSDAFTGGTQWVVLNFTGENQNNFHSGLSAEVSEIGDYIYTASGASTVYKILYVDSDGVYSATWIKPNTNTANLDVSWSPSTTDFDDTSISLNVTANADVVKLMSENDKATTTIEISDQVTGVVFYTLDIIWEKETVIT